MKTFSSAWHRANKKRLERRYQYHELSKERRIELKKLKEARREQS